MLSLDSFSLTIAVSVMIKNLNCLLLTIIIASNSNEYYLAIKR